jgi:hypothetical protein
MDIADALDSTLHSAMFPQIATPAIILMKSRSRKPGGVCQNG